MSLHGTGDLGKKLALSHGEAYRTRSEKRRWQQKARRYVQRMAKGLGRDPQDYKLGHRYVMGLGDILAACGPLGRELMARQVAEAAE